MDVQHDQCHFSELLRNHRRNLGATQRQLAVRSMVSIRAIRDLENGRISRPRRDTVRLIATGLGLSGQVRTDFERAAAGEPIPVCPGCHRPRGGGVTTTPSCTAGIRSQRRPA